MATLIALLRAHPYSVVEIAARCLQKFHDQVKREEEVCFVRWKEGLEEGSVWISGMSWGLGVKTDVIVTQGPTACSHIKQHLVQL